MIEEILITISVLSAIGLAVAVPAVAVLTVADMIGRRRPQAEPDHGDADLSDWVTVDQVIVDMGLEPHRDLTWAVGRQMRALHIERTGKSPISERRVKTSGKGSHSKAIYPPWMRSDLEAMVRATTNKEGAA